MRMRILNRPGVTGASVEGIWQALEVFDSVDIDRSKLTVTSGELRCGDRVMSAGDSCDHITNGSTRTNTYEQEQAEQNRVANLVQNAGLGIIGLSGPAIVWVLVSSGVRASRTKPGAPLPA